MKRRGGKRRGGRKTIMVNRALAPIPQRFITKMKYSETFVISSGQPRYAFRLNSIYDPNYSGVGHQPYGRDQLSALYNRYRVIAASYVITGFNASSAIRVAAQPSNELLTAGTVSEMCENPRAQFIVQYPGAQPQKIVGKTYLPSLVGRSKSQYMADDRYASQVDTNPAEAAYITVIAQDLTDSFGALSINCTITMEYTVEWFDVIHLGQS